MSVVSTAASDNQTLDTLHKDRNEIDADTMMLLDGQEPPQTPSRPPASATEPPPSSTNYTRTATTSFSGRRPPLVIPPPPAVHVVHMSNGTIVVEELDTPAIRKQKSQKKRAERKIASLSIGGGAGAQGVGSEGGELGGLASAIQASFMVPGSEQGVGPGAAQQLSPVSGSLSGPGVPGNAAPLLYQPPLSAVRGRHEDVDEEEEMGSELSDLSDVGAEVVKKRPGRGRKKKVPPTSVGGGDGVEGKTSVRPLRSAPLPVVDPSAERGAIVIPEGQMIEGGTLGSYLCYAFCRFFF